MTNVAVIGCGYIGGRHARSLLGLPDATLATFVDRDLARATELRETLQSEGRSGAAEIAVTSDVESVLRDPKIDAVVIATHHDSHPSLAIAAARAGKHIFVEKPLALTNEACREIEAAVQETGVQMVVGFQARHAPLVRRGLAWVPNPRVVLCQVVAGRWEDDSWAQQPATGGCNVLSQGVHGFDLLTHAAGAAPLVVHAEGGIVTHNPATTTVIDTVLVTIRFANGVVGSAVIGDFGPSPWTLVGFFQFFDGAGRSATVHHFYEGLSLGTAGSQVVPFEPATEPAQELSLTDLPTAERDDPYGYQALMAEFLACARANRPPTIAANVHNGRRATATTLACFQSIRTGLPVTLED